MRTGQPFASPEQTALDLDQIRELGANVIRIYHVPPRWFLDLAEAAELKVLVDIPWRKHLCFRFSSGPGGGAAKWCAMRSCRLRGASGGVRLQHRERNSARTSFAGAGRAKFSGFYRGTGCEEARGSGMSLHLQQFSFDGISPVRASRILSASMFICTTRDAFKNYLAPASNDGGRQAVVLGELGIDSLRNGKARKCEFLSVANRSCLRDRAGRGGRV